ncbi:MULTISPECIES: 5'-nucleotidase [unclassified Marinobacter]|uniref:5'-nucleotidase n=1 Tax=unclassified Marinobacter TaxID=83889 RepID=UPI0030087CEB
MRLLNCRFDRLDKSKMIKAFEAHIFFDDQDVHLEPAAKYSPAGKVPYRSGSPLKDSEKQ